MGCDCNKPYNDIKSELQRDLIYEKNYNSNPLFNLYNKELSWNDKKFGTYTNNEDNQNNNIQQIENKPNLNKEEKEYKNNNNLYNIENTNIDNTNIENTNIGNDNNENNNNNNKIENSRNENTELILKNLNIDPKINNDIENIENKNLIPVDSFSKYIFSEINNIRKDPKKYITILENSKSKITQRKNRIIYKSKVKVALTKGIPAFDEAINYLKEINPMNELIFNPKMCIELPENENDITDKKYIKKKVKEISNKGIYIKIYWRDIIDDEETCFILMIVDDTGDKSGLKTKNILNPNMKYIGICSIKINKKFACYITLSDR